MNDAERTAYEQGQQHTWNLCKERDNNLSGRVKMLEDVMREVARLAPLRDYQEILKLAQIALADPTLRETVASCPVGSY